MNVKKELTINFSERTINITESFSKKAQIYGSTEYIMLQNALKDFPTYKIEVIKKSKRAKDCHKGLTAKYMYEYIKTIDEKEKTKIIDTFNKFFIIDESGENTLHLRSEFDFVEVKKWFLKQYPEIDNAVKELRKNLDVIVERKVA